MTPPLQVAEPADEPQAALIATCRCRHPIWRPTSESERWRHDNGGVTCEPPDPPFEAVLRGDSA